MKTSRSILFLVLNTITIISLAQTPAEKLKTVFKGNNKQILVAAHRGDWRNAPENSLNALYNSIRKGFDIMELDVKMSKDSQMVVMHDNTIDRTTNAKGKVGDYTLEELKKFRLKNGLGRVTENQIPSMSEMMLAAKGKILINVDKGNDHLDLVFKVLRETSTIDQAIVNVGDDVPYGDLKAKNNIPQDAYLMVVVNVKKNEMQDIIKSYAPNQKIIVQPIFDTDTLTNLKTIKELNGKPLIWLNSLWPSLNGGHDDDRAVEKGEKEESWGWLINYHPVILQTDRPAELLIYLKERGLHH
ncbi:glycerophosphodiester phosphodiesterase family protein [Pedobacter roseus]|uniref:Glycerophosphodiester phosphodiesterase family protein n=1 Tax=Pedobacter roseus TaxID=336820 RepID=A0A7G9QI33_9SPHI|nr:glycerophosphodiester phosphodiesterase family protein [Pedobacter roseus]QNN43008.1 glycerophosphodiester phosphodiesterase family protein [Pedobacter roseus]